MLRSVFAFLVVVSFATTGYALPCDGVARNKLTAQEKSAFIPAIGNHWNASVNIKYPKETADHLQITQPIEIVTEYHVKDWMIIEINNHLTDFDYLFYRGTPLLNTYVTDWSGAAQVDEEEEITKWVTEHANGIPSELAHCFAWHVTKEPDF
jgi:hypothetical protein